MKQSYSYEDIIDLPHHVSRVHAPMSMQNRAAQFSPFQALTGYDSAVKEAAHRFEDEVINSIDRVADPEQNEA